MRRLRKPRPNEGRMNGKREMCSKAAMWRRYVPCWSCFMHLRPWLPRIVTGNFPARHIPVAFPEWGESRPLSCTVRAGKLLTKAMMLFLEAALPLLFIGILVAVAVTFFQTRMAFSMDVLKFKGERISPLKGFKRMMSVRSVVELIKALIKITILGWVAYDLFQRAG